jgi:hypothetical protein
LLCHDTKVNEPTPLSPPWRGSFNCLLPIGCNYYKEISNHLVLSGLRT